MKNEVWVIKSDLHHVDDLHNFSVHISLIMSFMGKSRVLVVMGGDSFLRS